LGEKDQYRLVFSVPKIHLLILNIRSEHAPWLTCLIVIIVVMLCQ